LFLFRVACPDAVVDLWTVGLSPWTEYIQIRTLINQTCDLELISAVLCSNICSQLDVFFIFLNDWSCTGWDKMTKKSMKTYLEFCPKPSALCTHHHPQESKWTQGEHAWERTTVQNSCKLMQKKAAPKQRKKHAALMKHWLKLRWIGEMKHAHQRFSQLCWDVGSYGSNLKAFTSNN